MLLDALILNATVGEETSFIVTVNDTDDDTFTFDNTLPEGANFEVDDSNDKMGTFTWTPPNTDLVDGLRY